MYIHTSSCLFHLKPVQHIHIYSALGLLTHNATWCQKRGCICISSTRRTYGRIHAVHPSILNVKILQDRISKEEEREDPRRELQSSYQPKSKSASSISTCNPAKFPSFQPSRAKKTILHTELILLQEFSKKYYNYKAHPMQIDTRHPPTSVPCASKHSTSQN